jgi:Family of unknown function (DUF5340)
MSVPLPSHVHYELLLQMLERQSLFATNEYPQQRSQVQQLIIMLRKALTQQKQIEEDLHRLRIPVEYRWALNQDLPNPSASDTIAPTHGGPTS